MAKPLWIRGICISIALVAIQLGATAKLLADDAPAAPPKFEWNASLSDWHVVGPIPKLDTETDELDRTLVPNEAELRPDAPLVVGGKSYEWKSCHASIINFIRVFDLSGNATNNLLAYAYTEFTSDSDQEVLLALQHDDGAAVWLNGVEVLRSKENTASSIDQDVVKVSLKAGTNKLLAKVSQYYGSWEFGARIRPTGLDNPLFSLGFVGATSGDASRLPLLNVDLLNDAGNNLVTLHVGGGRTKQNGYGYTAYAPPLQPAPATIRIRYDEPGLDPFDKSYPWSDVTAGNVSIHPAVAQPFRGKVIDGESGLPIKTAELRVDPGDRKAAGDENGRFELKSYEPLIQYVAVAAPGYEPRSIIAPWPPQDDWSIKLSRGGHVLRGRVLDADGKPLADAKISAYGSNRDINLVTDENGRFETCEIGGATAAVYPTVTHSGHVAKDQFTLALNAEGPTEVEWRLESGAVITGRVTAKDDGRPLAGIKISTGEDRFSGNRVNPETRTDADGRYRLAGAKLGSTLVHAFSDDFAPAMQSVKTGTSGSVTADFQLEPGAAVTGRVTDPDGKPVAGVHVITDTWNEARMFLRERSTDADGTFELPHMPTTPVLSDLLKQGYVSNRRNQFIGGQHYDITLAPVVDRTIHVKLADTGKPPENLEMQLGYQWQGQQEISWQDTRYNRIGKYDSSDGSIHLREDETENAKRLLRLRVSGYHDAIVPLPSQPGEALSPEVSLQKAQTTTARIVDAETGAPLADVIVAFVSLQDRLRMDTYSEFNQRSQALQSFSGFRTTTAADGTVELPVISKGESPDMVVLRKEGGFLYVPNATALLAANQIEIPFPKACTISGRISAGDLPLAEEEVHVSWMPIGNPQNQWNFPFGYGGVVKTDQDGQYQFAGLGAGRYQLARVKTFKDPTGNMYMSAYLATEELVVLPGQDVTHDIELPTGCIVTGQTVGPDGKPAPNCRVTANSTQRSQSVDMAQSDADGYFTLTYLAPGHYSLNAEQYEGTRNEGFRPGPTGSKTIKVTSGISPTVKIKLQTRNQNVGLVAGGIVRPQTTLVGSVAPDFSGKLLDGDKSFRLSDQIGKVVVVNFWMGSAQPTRSATAEFNKLYQKYKENADVAFAGIALDQNADTVRAAVKDQEFEFPVIYESRDASEKIAMSFGMRGIPITFVVDREGRFAAEPSRGVDFIAALEAALKKPAALAADGLKPARLTVKFTVDNEAAGIPGTSIALKALDAGGTISREETIRVAGQTSQLVWLYPPMGEGGQIQATAEAEGCPKQEQVVRNPQANAEVTFAFTSPRILAGRVAANDGATPVPNAKVSAFRNDGVRRTAVTDADGNFKVNVFPGTYYLTFEGNDDFAPVSMQRESIDIDADTDPDSVTVEACSTITVTGIVNDVDGKPAVGAQVRTAANATVVRTDANGHFELRGVPSHGQVAIVAMMQQLVAQSVLTDVDPDQPITLTLQPQRNINPAAAATGLTGKMPRLDLHNVIHDEPVDWQPAPDSDTLIAFCSLWHPAGRELAQRAQKWADDHHVYVTIVSTDWSLDDARRRWETLGLKPPSIRSPLYAGPGGLEIAKDWKLSSPAQAYLISPQGNIVKTLDPDKMQ